MSGRTNSCRKSPLGVLVLASFMVALVVGGVDPCQARIGFETRGLRTYRFQSFSPAQLRASVLTSGQVGVALGGRRYVLDLVPNNMRNPALTVLADGLTQLAVKPVTTYKGVVRGVEGSVARLAIRDDRIEGYVWTGDDWWFIEPIIDPQTLVADSIHLVYQAKDMESIDMACGVRTQRMLGDASSQALPSFSGSEGYLAEGAVRRLEIATDSDYYYYLDHGADSAADVESILNQVEGIYESQVGVTFDIVFQNVWTSPDPYSSTDPRTLVKQFSTYWSSNFSAVHRDVSHLFTGRDLEDYIGVAYFRAVCDNDRGYGLSQDFSTYTGRLVALVAHELGHNFGASHDMSLPPTLMYPSNTDTATFSDYSIGQIASYVSSLSESCMTTSCASGTDAADGGGTGEVCDGRDNDCDGLVDENNPGGGSSCSTGSLGVCGRGTRQCIGGFLRCVANGTKGAEVCDGRDNDCDGEVDEDTGGEGCDTGEPGVCAEGVERCVNGLSQCVPRPLVASPAGVGGLGGQGRKVLRCQKTINRSSQGFASKKLKAMQGCVHKGFRCIQREPLAKQVKCLRRAGRKCKEAIRRVEMAGCERAANKIKKACWKVPLDLVAAEHGLGFRPGAECIGTVDEIAACVLEHHSCVVELLMSSEVPRSAAILNAEGVDATQFSCLAPASGEVVLGDPDSLGRAVVKCEKSIKKESEKLVRAELKHYQFCATRAADCVHTKRGDSQTACMVAAREKCWKKVKRMQEKASTRAGFRGAVRRACQQVSVSRLLADKGLGFAGGAQACLEVGVPSLASLEDIIECLERRHQCMADKLVAAEFPRTEEFMASTCQVLGRLFPCPALPWVSPLRHWAVRER